jgi:hypothetical protein
MPFRLSLVLRLRQPVQLQHHRVFGAAVAEKDCAHRAADLALAEQGRQPRLRGSGQRPPYRQRYWFAKSSTERVMLGAFIK